MGDNSDNVPGVSGLGEKKLAKLYPELMTEQQMTLQDVIKIAAEKINEHQLYASIIERSHQLHINERIMSLHHLPLSDENIAEIEYALENANTDVDRKQFLSTYYVDNLGNSIPNIEDWLNEVFGSLSNFK